MPIPDSEYAGVAMAQPHLEAEAQPAQSGETGVAVHRLMEEMVQQRSQVPSAGSPVSEAQLTPEASNADASNPNAETATKVNVIPEVIAQAAYTRIAEELKWKGDFPVWDVITDRAKALYVEGVEHIRSGNAPRTRFEEIVVEVLGANG